jgi:hypothetical protein
MRDQHVFAMVGLSGFEPLTSRLSGVRSNQLSYRPLCLLFSQSELFLNTLALQPALIKKKAEQTKTLPPCTPLKGGDPAARSRTATLLRLHPNHRPYLRHLLPKRVSPATSGMTNFRDVTGGVYKARERIHRGVADPRLLAIPASRRRIAACDPN